MAKKMPKKLKENMSIMIYLTAKELKEKGKQEIEFEWNLSGKNVNVIPKLELYDDEGNTFETIDATEFSEILQELLRVVNILSIKFLSN